MRTISFGANVEDEYSSFLAKNDRGLVGRVPLKSIKVGDMVFGRYLGVGEVIGESEKSWRIKFEEEKVRLVNKESALNFLYELFPEER